MRSITRLTIINYKSVFIAHCLAIVLVGVCLPTQAAEEDDSGAAKPKPATAELELSFRLIDENGQPVHGAKAGLEAAYLILPDNKTAKPDWHYYLETTSDASGMVHLKARLVQFQRACLICRHAERDLVAIHPIDADRRDGAADVILRPECRVSGTIECQELTSLSRSIGPTTVRLLADKRIAMACHSGDGTFHFFLPPGEFVVSFSGSDILHARRTLIVPPGQAELSMGATAIRARPLALLAGKPAPELRGVRAWKNSKGIRLADLRGKWVLLEFWGYWCGPCIGRMPDLFAAYDRYKDRGLEVIGIHCHGEGDGVVETVAELDEKLKDIVAKHWAGRELPFPVAITSGFVPFVEGGKAKALGPISADYGIESYPSLVLIDPQGNVVGEVELDELEERMARRD